jgi:hypothetical protein
MKKDKLRTLLEEQYAIFCWNEYWPNTDGQDARVIRLVEILDKVRELHVQVAEHIQDTNFLRNSEERFGSLTVPIGESFTPK